MFTLKKQKQKQHRNLLISEYHKKHSSSKIMPDVQLIFFDCPMVAGLEGAVLTVPGAIAAKLPKGL